MEGRTERETLWEETEKCISLLMVAWSSVAFFCYCRKVKGDWLSFLLSLALQTHTHTHTCIYIFVVAGTRLLMARRKTQRGGPTLYVKGRSSLPGEHEWLNLNRDRGRNKNTHWPHFYNDCAQGEHNSDRFPHVPSVSAGQSFFLNLLWINSSSFGWERVCESVCVFVYLLVCLSALQFPIFKDSSTAWESSSL